jgi:RNase P subunit RPR2
MVLDMSVPIGLLFISNSFKEGGIMQAYCVKCRAKKEMSNAKSITMKNGKPATQGVCPSCGTKMFRIGKR